MSCYLEGLFSLKKIKISFLKIIKINIAKVRLNSSKTGSNSSGFWRKKRNYYFLKKHSVFRYTMMISNLNLVNLPECVCEMRYIDSALLTPCAE